MERKVRRPGQEHMYGQKIAGTITGSNRKTKEVQYVNYVHILHRGALHSRTSNE